MSLYDADVADDEEERSLDDTYLTFHVGSEEYAVPVAHVTEIVRLPKSFALPDVPNFVRGVINLRGKVIPLVDVRSRFGLVDAAYTDRTVVVVLEVGDNATGLVVDGVTEVAEIPAADIDTRAVSAAGSQLIRGLGKRTDRVSFILDVNRLLSNAA